MAALNLNSKPVPVYPYPGPRPRRVRNKIIFVGNFQAKPLFDAYRTWLAEEREDQAENFLAQE